jgi:pimeloyl-ACP methyl ester carboxylesterase
MAGQTAETITVNGCAVEMLRGGTGETLLFLHGAGGINGWAPYLQALATRFTLVAPSHPGFGRSDTPPWLDNMSDMAFFYLDLIEQLDLRDIHLAGNSLGGWLAAEIAVRNADRLKTLTLVSPAGLRVVGVPMGDIFMWGAEERVRNTFCDQKLAEQRLATNVSEEDAEISLRNHFTTAKLAWSPRFHNPDLEKWLHRIRIPTMILWGDSDRIFPPAHGEAYHAAIPGSQLRIIPQCGHLPHQEKMDAFLAGIDAITKGAAA